jgi:hypothetical protein
MTASEPDRPGDLSRAAEEKSERAEEKSERSRDHLPDPTSPVDWAQRFAVGTLTGLRNRSHLSEVERFALFIGYPRSGHSLIGSMLNAHPDMVIAHELGVFDYVNRHFGRTTLYGLILERTVRSVHSAGSGPTTTTPSTGSSRANSAGCLY